MTRETCFIGAAALCALALAVAGCKGWAVGPDYKEPEVKAADVTLPDAGYPTTNKTETGELKPAEGKDDTRKEISAESIKTWWTQFNDDVLTDLVDTAVSNNLSFLMAQERLVQARHDGRHLHAFRRARLH